MRLADKIALITGAASGIGRACAVVFAGEGAKVVVADVDDEGGGETVNIIKSNGGEALFVHTDVSSAPEAENLIKTAVDKFGRIDVLLNVAGIMHDLLPLEDISEEVWDGIYAVNVKGIFHTMKYAVPLMKKARSGAIVNVASAGGINPRWGGSAYTSSKGAVITLTKAISLELSEYGVRANCINPEGTDTRLVLAIAEGSDDPEKTRQELISQIPLGRFIKPEEIAYAAVYLASDESLMLSGTHLNVNAGFI
jgi:3-oxoacyl-[acyl-carrier protein] reductase